MYIRKFIINFTDKKDPWHASTNCSKIYNPLYYKFHRASWFSQNAFIDL